MSMWQWFESKLQEVENEEQLLRKLHTAVDSLVNHRKGDSKYTFSQYTVLNRFPFFKMSNGDGNHLYI